MKDISFERSSSNAENVLLRAKYNSTASLKKIVNYSEPSILLRVQSGIEPLYCRTLRLREATIHHTRSSAFPQKHNLSCKSQYLIRINDACKRSFCASLPSNSKGFLVYYICFCDGVQQVPSGSNDFLHSVV